MSQSEPQHLLPPPAEAGPRPRYRELATVLAAGLIVLIAAILTVPFWAPSLLPLLPWGGANSDPELVQRIERLETASDQVRQTSAQQGSALDQIGRRLGSLETKQGEQQQGWAKAASGAQQLESRIGALEATRQKDQQNASETGPRLNQLDKRIAALEAKPEGPPKELAELHQQVEKLSKAGTDLAARVAALEKPNLAKPTVDPTDAAALLVVLRIRDAIETARPFAAEYEALMALARHQPEIGEAAAPLAEAAKTGVPSRAVLAKRLHEVAASITNAEPPPPEPDWGSEALARLRGLVMIRRVSGAGQNVPEAAVSTAENKLAAGDLAGAISALDKLDGAPAKSAGPWLQLARQRLTVETALRRSEGLLAARLGNSADQAVTSPPPG